VRFGTPTSQRCQKWFPPGCNSRTEHQTMPHECQAVACCHCGARACLPLWISELRRARQVRRQKYSRLRVSGMKLTSTAMSPPWTLFWPTILSSRSRMVAPSANPDTLRTKQNSALHVEISDRAEVKVRMHGNVAVVTGAYHEKGTSKGKLCESRDRATDVWMRNANGGWPVIAARYSIPARQSEGLSFMVPTRREPRPPSGKSSRFSPGRELVG
jgi:hypothetical protein